jgi:hypothetical protein
MITYVLLVAFAFRTFLIPSTTNYLHAPHGAFSLAIYVNTKAIAALTSLPLKSSYHAMLYSTNIRFHSQTTHWALPLPIPCRQPRSHQNWIRSTLFPVSNHRRLIRLIRIYNFWCSMLVYKLFALCFVYTSWRFYAFSGNNLLPGCHIASSLFSAIFLFQKW